MSDDLQIPAMAGMRRPSYRVERPASGLDAGTKQLLMFAAVAVVALMAVVGGWAMLHRGPAVVPVIEADVRPLRVKPDNPGGLQVAGADEQDTGVPTMAPTARGPRAARVARAGAGGPAGVPASRRRGLVRCLGLRPPLERRCNSPPSRPRRRPAANGNGSPTNTPTCLAGRQMVVQKTETTGKPMWRVRTGGFTDIADATGFCGKLRAKGAGCSIATF